MKVVILCGGQGSRIRDVSDVMPKPMLPIGGKPILWHIMKLYAQHGFKDFVLCLGYKGHMIRDFFLNFRTKVTDCTLTLGHPNDIKYYSDTNFDEQDWRVTLVDTGEATMTGGRIVRARKFIDTDQFCLTYGDGVCDVNIKQLIETHKKSGLAATLTAVHSAGRFGELDIDGAKVRTFNEKPAISAGRINGGFFVLDNRRVWEYFKDAPDLVFEREPLARLAQAGQLGCYPHDGYWYCMDTPREYIELNQLWDTGKAPWKTWA